MSITIWLERNSNTPSLASTMHSVSGLISFTTHSGSALTPILSATGAHASQFSAARGKSKTSRRRKTQRETQTAKGENLAAHLNPQWNE
jgi:hypothetical protein